MGLYVSLQDGEEVIINGALLRAKGRAVIEVANQASVLRGSEVLKLDQANSPARRLYFACTMAYLDPAGAEKYQQVLVDLVEQFLGALEEPSAVADCAAFAHRVALGDFYKALSICQRLIAYEAEALARLERAA